MKMEHFCSPISAPMYKRAMQQKIHSSNKAGYKKNA